MKGTGDTKKYILKNSNRKDKRYEIVIGLNDDRNSMRFHFGSDVGKTYIDGRTEKEKKAWVARHKDDKNFNSKDSAIYHSRKLLWNKPSLSQSIKAYEKEHGVKILNQT